MFMLVTICVLFIYTFLLIIFFMAWCALLPKRTFPDPELLPGGKIKSPRRHSAFVDFESVSSSCCSQSLELLHQKLSLSSPTESSEWLPKKKDDYLHPKYSLDLFTRKSDLSLPPVKQDIADQLLATVHLLRTPMSLHRHIPCTPASPPIQTSVVRIQTQEGPTVPSPIFNV